MLCNNYNKTMFNNWLGKSQKILSLFSVANTQNNGSRVSSSGLSLSFLMKYGNRIRQSLESQLWHSMRSSKVYTHVWPYLPKWEDSGWGDPSEPALLGVLDAIVYQKDWHHVTEVFDSGNLGAAHDFSGLHLYECCCILLSILN